MAEDPPERNRQDLLSIESMRLEEEPKGDQEPQKLVRFHHDCPRAFSANVGTQWDLMQSRGAHISSWLIPIDLLPPGEQVVPPSATTVIPSAKPNSVDPGPISLKNWTRFEPSAAVRSDGYFRPLYPAPSTTHAVSIYQCVIQYAGEPDFEPEKVCGLVHPTSGCWSLIAFTGCRQSINRHIR